MSDAPPAYRTGTRCVGCGLEAASQLEVCPKCGGAEFEVTSTELGRFDFAVRISVAQFSCESCGQPFLLNKERVCPHCGDKIGPEAVDLTTQRRIDEFGPRLESLVADVRRAGKFTFSERGRRPNVDDYITTLRTVAFDDGLRLIANVKELLGETSWDPPTPGIDKRLDAVDESFRGLNQVVERLAAIAPPPALLAMHRETTRTISTMVQALATFLDMLTAPYHDELIALQQKGQAEFDDASVRADKLARLVARTARTISEPGWWVIGDSFDAGRVAWETQDQRTATISAAAASVRTTFAKVPGVTQLPDAQAVLLVPAIVSSSFHDPDRLVLRACQARQLLDAADVANPGWIDDPGLLVRLIAASDRQLVDQIVRLGYALTHEEHHKILFQSLISVFQKLIEGPMGGFGTVLAIAGRVPSEPQLTLCGATADPMTAGEAITTLASFITDGAPSLSMLVRNADGHYGFTIGVDDIEVRDQKVKDGGVIRRRSERLSDGDFVEMIIDLNELIVALELALLPYLWGHPSPAIQAALSSLPADEEAKVMCVRLLGGLAGLMDLTITHEDGILSFAGRYAGPADKNPFLEVLGVVAGAVGLWDTATEIVLEVDHTGGSNRVTLNRTEIITNADVESSIYQHGVALVVRNVRAQTERGASDPQVLHARYVLLPAARECAELMLRTLGPSSAAADYTALKRYLLWLRDQLIAHPPPVGIEDLHEAVQATVRNLARNLAVRQSAAGNRRFAAKLDVEFRSAGIVLVESLKSCEDLTKDDPGGYPPERWLR
jgi:Zn finger protein HypA/HybF involved in hydrogenase expression